MKNQVKLHEQNLLNKNLQLLNHFQHKGPPKPRSWQGVQEINQNRGEIDVYHTLMSDLCRDKKCFYIYFRMIIECFD